MAAVLCRAITSASISGRDCRPETDRLQEVFSRKSKLITGRKKEKKGVWNRIPLPRLKFTGRDRLAQVKGQ
jgi:hypothetical protein